MIPFTPITLGININNFPGFIKWDHDKKVHEIGTSYQIGLGFKTPSDSMKAGLTFTKDYGDEEIKVNIGGEFKFTEFLAVRLGYYKSSFSGGLGIYFFLW